MNKKQKQKLVSYEDVNLGTLIIDGFDSQIVEMDEADFGVCPKCGSLNITYGDTETENIFIYRVHTCYDCGTTWKERYDLTRVEIEEGKITVIED